MVRLQTKFEFKDPINKDIKDIKDIKVRDIWSKKQKRSYNTIKTGLELSRREGKTIRFLTLTTSDLQFDISDYDEKQLNDHHRKLKQRIQRMTPLKMVQQGYIKTSDLRRYYPNTRLNQKLGYEYFRVETDEGNGVLHILYKGDYLPYNYLVDNWQDIHNSWDLNIKFIGLKKSDIRKVSGYVVSQYISGHNSSYVRSSQAWKWIFRGYRKEWLSFLNLHIRDYTKQYADYKGNWHAPYKEKQDIDFKDIISKWNNVVFDMVSNWYIPSLEACFDKLNGSAI